MKKLSNVLVLSALALVIAPVAHADSFYYSINGTNFSANLTLTTSGPNDANGTYQAGAYTVLDVSGTFTDSSGTYAINSATETAANGSNATSPTTSTDGLYLFDNLLYASAPGNNILDWGGILVDNGTITLNLFSGAPGDMYFYFADAANYANNQIVVEGGGPATATLVATPEPGSLLLLGTGLLALAFFAFRKAKPANELPTLQAA